MADTAVCGLPASIIHLYAGLHGQCDLPAEGDQRFFCDQSDGSDVYGEGSDRTVLSDDRKPVPVGSVLSADPASGITGWKPAGKEAPLCRIWDLRYS